MGFILGTEVRHIKLIGSEVRIAWWLRQLVNFLTGGQTLKTKALVPNLYEANPHVQFNMVVFAGSWRHSHHNLF